MTNSANLGLSFFHVRYTRPENGGPYHCEWHYRRTTDKVDIALGGTPRHWVLVSVQAATIFHGADWLRDENLLREGEQADLLLGFHSLDDRNQYFGVLGRQAMDVAVHSWVNRNHRKRKDVVARFYFHELNTNGIVVTGADMFDGEPTARQRGDGRDFSAFFCSNSDLWGLHKSAEGRVVPVKVASKSHRCAGLATEKEKPLPITELTRKLSQDLDTALQRVLQNEIPLHEGKNFQSTYLNVTSVEMEGGECICRVELKTVSPVTELVHKAGVVFRLELPPGIPNPFAKRLEQYHTLLDPDTKEQNTLFVVVEKAEHLSRLGVQGTRVLYKLKLLMPFDGVHSDCYAEITPLVLFHFRAVGRSSVTAVFSPIPPLSRSYEEAVGNVPIARQEYGNNLSMKPKAAEQLTPALKGHEVFTKDVIIGFDIIKRRSSSVFKKDQGENWPAQRAPEPMMTQHLELYVERQARMPSLRRSHINLLTTKGKGYGPLFFIEEGLEADLCDALASLHKESSNTLPLLVTTVIKTSPEAKPVSTPLGRLHEATSMRVMPDFSHTAMFYDFGVHRADLVQPDGE